MTIPADVLGFLKTHATNRVLSVYVDNALTEPARRGAWRTVLHDGIDRERTRLEQSSLSSLAELQAFERCAASVAQGLPETDETSDKSGWMSLCADDGEMLEAQLPVAPSARVTWSEGPILFPYLIATRTDSAVIALIDADQVRILRLHRGMIHPIDALETDANTETETSTHRQLSVIAGNDAHVVVGGTADETARFVGSLPVELAERTVVSGELRMTTPTGDMPSIVFHALTDLFTRRQRDTLSALERRAKLTRHAALGVDAVVAAAAARAIEQLLITESLWRERPDTIEMLMHDVLRAGATVAIATPECASELDALGGGIVAELRFAVASASGATTEIA